MSAPSHLSLVQHFELVTLDELLGPGGQSQHHQELVLVDVGLQEVVLVTEQHVLQRVSLRLSGCLCDYKVTGHDTPSQMLPGASDGCLLALLTLFLLTYPLRRLFSVVVSISDSDSGDSVIQLEL